MKSNLRTFVFLSAAAAFRSRKKTTDCRLREICGS